MNFLKNCFDFQVLLSSFMGPYFLFYILTLCIYPVKTYTGEFACYLMIYSRSVYVRKSNFYLAFHHQTLSSIFRGKSEKIRINLRLSCNKLFYQNFILSGYNQNKMRISRHGRPSKEFWCDNGATAIFLQRCISLHLSFPRQVSS